MPGSSGRLYVWTTKKDRQYYVLERFTQKGSGNVNGVVVVQSLLDAATGMLATKYEDSMSTIHARLSEQQTYASAVNDVYNAIETMGETAWRDENWSNVCAALELDHPLNPKIADAEPAIHHLGGINLHLTSRKRQRVADHDETDESVFVWHESQTHNHDNDVFNRVYTEVIRLAVRAVCAGASTDNGRMYKQGSNNFFRIQPSEIGMVGAAGAKAAFYCAVTGQAYYSKAKLPWPAKGNYTDVLDVKTSMPAAQLELTDSVLSQCSLSLLLPAMISSRRGANVYAKSIHAIEKMMVDTDAYDGADPIPVENPVRIDVLRLFPLNGGAERNDVYDHILDFDTLNGWCIGNTPTVNTDAAAAAHWFVSDL